MLFFLLMWILDLSFTIENISSSHTSSIKVWSKTVFNENKKIVGGQVFYVSTTNQSSIMIIQQKSEIHFSSIQDLKYSLNYGQTLDLIDIKNKFFWTFHGQIKWLYRGSQSLQTQIFHLKFRTSSIHLIMVKHLI